MAEARRCFADARTAWIDRCTDALRTDGRVRGAWLVGSLGRGDEDVFSNVDLVVAVDDRLLPAAIADPVVALGLPGRVQFQRDMTAAVDGAFLWGP